MLVSVAFHDEKLQNFNCPFWEHIFLYAGQYGMSFLSTARPLFHIMNGQLCEWNKSPQNFVGKFRYYNCRYLQWKDVEFLFLTDFVYLGNGSAEIIFY